MKEDFRDYINNISPIEDETFEELLKHSRHISLKKGEYYVDFDEIPKTLGFLSEGVLRAYFLCDSGKEYNKSLFKGPHVVGAYTAVISRSPNKIAQQALTDCELILFDYDAVLKVYNTHRDLETFARVIGEKFYMEKEQKELEMALMEAEERYKLFKESHPNVDQLIPQYHIASYLGVSATQLSRIRHKMKDEG